LNEVVKRVPCWAVVMAAIGGILLVGLLPREVRHNGLLAPIFGLVIWRLCFSSRISAALSVPALLLLGEASYALYITHYPVMQFVQRYLASAPVSVQFAIYVSCAVGISIAVFLVIERRARTLIRRALLNGHASIAKPSAPPTG